MENEEKRDLRINLFEQNQNNVSLNADDTNILSNVTEEKYGLKFDFKINDKHFESQLRFDSANSTDATISIHSPHTRGDSISLQKSIRIYVSLHNKTMIHRFSELYKPLFCGAKPDIRGAKPTEKP